MPPEIKSTETVAGLEMPEEMGEPLSMSLLGGKDVKPGDVIRLKVASVNDEDGTWTAEAVSEDVAEPVGINQMAQAFDQNEKV